MSDNYYRQAKETYHSLLLYSDTEETFEIEDITQGVKILTDIPFQSGRALAELACRYIPQLRRLLELYHAAKKVPVNRRFPETHRAVIHSMSTTVTTETARINAMLMSAWSSESNLVSYEEIKITLTRVDESMGNILTATIRDFEAVKHELIQLQYK